MRPMKTHDNKPLPDDIESLKRWFSNCNLKIKGCSKTAPRDGAMAIIVAKRFAASTEGLPAKVHCLTNLKHRLNLKRMKSLPTKPLLIPVKTRRPSIDASLPREDVLHDISDEDKVCDCCGHDLHRMGEETSEELEFIPATIKVLRHVRPKYSCRACENTALKRPLKSHRYR